MSAPRSLPAGLKPYAKTVVNGRLFGVVRKVNGVVTSTHKGCDFATPVGIPLEATITGKVSLVGGSLTHSWGYYLHIICDCPQKHVVEYHILRDRPTLTVGQRVTAGQIIGHTGSSGSLGGIRYAPHHHHGTSANGTYYDPLTIGWPSSTAAVTVTPFTPAKDTRTIMALKDTLTIYSAPGRGYLVVGPSFTREIIGNERLTALTDIVGIEGKAVTTREWDVIAEFFRGNDEVHGRVTPAQIEQIVKGALESTGGKASTDDLTAEIVEGVRGLFAKAGS